MLNFQLFGIPYVGADICGFQCASVCHVCAFHAFFPTWLDHALASRPFSCCGLLVSSSAEKYSVCVLECAFMG